jgi:hypothetical protein
MVDKNCHTYRMQNKTFLLAQKTISKGGNFIKCEVIFKKIFDSKNGSSPNLICHKHVTFSVMPGQEV